MFKTHTDLMTAKPEVVEQRLGAIFTDKGTVIPSSNWRVGIAITSDGTRYAWAVTNEERVDHAVPWDGGLDEYLLKFEQEGVREMIKEGVITQ